MLKFRLSRDQLDLQQKARTSAISAVLPVAWYYDEKDELPFS